jgi:hypothetical protein
MTDTEILTLCLSLFIGFGGALIVGIGFAAGSSWK